MHYKNGREAKEGDPVIAKTCVNPDQFRAGTLHSLVAKSDTCNGQIAVPIPGGTQNHWVTLKDCFHAGDAFQTIDSIYSPKPVDVPA